MKTPLDALRDAPEEINPALLMAWELKQREMRAGPQGLDVRDLLPQAAEIEAALEAGRVAVEQNRAALRLLTNAGAQPSRHVPEGF